MQIRRRVSVLRENGTVLTPIAGAPHSDPFQVTTEKPTPAGWRPYLMGPHDPPRFSYDRRTGRSEIGQITVRIQDARVAGSNTQRWASAYVGDEDGWDQLHGLTLLREIQIDGGAWEPEFRGIITRVKAPDRTAVGSILELFAQDERILGRDRRIFATAPHASIDYARGASVLPLGVPYGVAQGGANSWQGWTASAPLQGKILGKGISLGALTALTLTGISDFRIPRTVENRMTDALARLADGRVRVAGMHATICPHARVWVRRLDTNAEGEFYLSVTANVNAGSTYDGEAQAPVYIHDGYVSRIGITPLRNTSHPKYMALPPAGTDVEFYVYNAGPPTEDAPFLTGWVHPATFIRDLLDGKFSLLNEEWGDDFPPERSDGSVALQPLEYVEAELAALEADASIGRMRFEIPRSYLLLEFLAEQIFRVRHIAGVVHADGKFHFSDLRLKPDTASGAVTLDPDLVIRAEWEAGEDMAPAIDVTTYTDWYGDPDVIPPGSKDDPIAKVKVTRHSSHPTPYRFVSEKLRRFADVNTITIDALGARGDQEASRIAEPYREIFGRGAAYARMTVQRGPSTQDLYPGDIRIVDTDAIPNFASNERGGLRLMQCVLAIPKWPELELRMLDLGPSTVALPPTITSVTQNATDPTSAIDVALTLNAAGEPVGLEVATTATSQGVVPDEDSDLWRPAGRYDTAGTVTIGSLESGMRHRVRARTVAPRKLVSAWVSGLRADTAAANSVLQLTLTWQVDGSVLAEWKVGPATAGLRLYYQPHRAIILPDPTLSADAAASAGQHLFPANVVTDEMFTVVAEPYTGFSAGSVTGTAGEKVAASIETRPTRAPFGTVKAYVDDTGALKFSAHGNADGVSLRWAASKTALPSAPASTINAREALDVDTGITLADGETGYVAVWWYSEASGTGVQGKRVGDRVTRGAGVTPDVVEIREAFTDFPPPPATLDDRTVSVSLFYEAGVASLKFSYGDIDDPAPGPEIDGQYTINVAAGPATILHQLQEDGGGNAQVWPDVANRPDVQVTVHAYDGANGTGNLIGTSTWRVRWDAGVRQVPGGGTGKGSFTAGALLKGAGTDPIDELTGSLAGQVVRWDGTGFAASKPQWGDLENVPSSFTPSAHAASHSSGGGDPIAIAASQVTSGLFSNARISQASVVQHQGALSIAGTQLTGTIPSARLSGAYTGITQVGTLTSLAVSGTAQLSGAVHAPNIPEATGTPGAGGVLMLGNLGEIVRRVGPSSGTFVLTWTGEGNPQISWADAALTHSHALTSGSITGILPRSKGGTGANTNSATQGQILRADVNGNFINVDRISAGNLPQGSGMTWDLGFGGSINIVGDLSIGGTPVSLQGHTHTISQVTGLQAALDGKANLSGATFTGFVNVHAPGNIPLTVRNTGAGAQTSIAWEHDVGGGWSIRATSSGEFRFRRDTDALWHMTLSTANGTDTIVSLGSGSGTDQGYLSFSWQRNGPVMGQVPAAIYMSGSGGGSFPFDGIGHLVLQPRSSASRSIVFMTGNPPTLAGYIDHTGALYAEGSERVATRSWADGRFVSLTGSYADPSWLTSLAANKINAGTFKAGTFTFPGTLAAGAFRVSGFVGVSEGSGVVIVDGSNNFEKITGSGSNPLVLTYDGDGNILFTDASFTHTHDASAIVSGTLGVNQIPNLPASKITSGNLAWARMPVGQNQTWNLGTLGSVDIVGSVSVNGTAVSLQGHTHTTGEITGNLPASRVSAGTFSAGDFSFTSTADTWVSVNSSTSNANRGIKLTQGGADRSSFGYNNSSGVTWIEPFSTFQIQRAGAVNIRVESNGNVGIGYTSNQGYRFAVNGTGYYAGALTVAGGLTTTGDGTFTRLAGQAYLTKGGVDRARVAGVVVVTSVAGITPSDYPTGTIVLVK